MPRSQADEWAKNSAYKEDVYHTTNGRNIKPLMQDGFDLSKTKFGKLWGDGVYVSTDSETSEMYRRWVGPGSKRTTIRINVDNMVEYTADQYAGSPEKVFGKIYRQTVNDPNAPWADVYRRTKESMIASGESAAEPQVFAKIMKDLGVDAIRINTSAINEGLGGNQIIVFDPRRVVIIND